MLYQTELLIFFTGLIAGMINSIAGGGSFITYPALVFAGLPPIMANATNTFAATSGYISGAFAFRREIIAEKINLISVIIASLIGGLFGALLLINTSNEMFEMVVPWLMAIATILFVFGSKINLWLAKIVNNKPKVLNEEIDETYSYEKNIYFYGLMFLASFYGGYFNAGQGIIILAFLVLLAFKNIHFMNGMKLAVSAVAGIIAIVIFMFEGAIDFHFGIIMLVGNLLGGFFAAHISRYIPQIYVRIAVIIASIGITLYFFNDVYRII